MKTYTFVDAELQELADFHIERALDPSLVVIGGLVRDGMIHPTDLDGVTVDPYQSIADVLYFWISDRYVSDIEFWAVLRFYNDSQLPPYAFLTGGCDYTGWDCRAGSDIIYATNLKDLFRYALTEAARKEWGITL